MFAPLLLRSKKIPSLFFSLAAKCAQSWETDAFKALPSISDGDPKMLLHLFFIFEGKKYLLMSH